MVRRILLSALLASSAALVFGQQRAEWAPNEVIVKFPDKGSFSYAYSSLALGAQEVGRLDNGSTKRMRLPRNVSLVQAAAMYKAAGAEYVEPNYIYRAVYTPNDSYYSAQYGPQLIKCPDAWEITKGSSSIIIAIVDTGVELTHPDLASKLVPGTDLVNRDSNPTDDNGHGTHCAGVAAAMTNNAAGIAGVAPNCSIMPVKVLDSEGSGYLSTIAEGIRWATDHGAKVISLSLGASSQSQTLQDAVDYATANGVLVVAAAGNDNSSAKFYPAACTGVLSVGAVNSNDARASFSNYGSWVSVAAPGVNVLSCWIGGRYANASGTSMATPHVAGEAALLYSYFGATSTPAFIKAHIEDNCDNIGTWVAHGRVNVLGALTGPGNPNDVVPTPVNGIVTASAFNLIQGSVLQGDLESMSASDDDRAVFQSAGSGKRVFEGWASFNVGPAAKLKKVVLNFESMGTINGSLSFMAYNFTKKKWVSFTSFGLTKTDKSGSVQLKLTWAQYVNAGGEMRIDISRSAWAAKPFTVSIDKFNLTVTSS